MNERSPIDVKKTPRSGRASARHAVLINLFVTPGMGSLMAGKILEGVAQLVLAVAGFALLIAWFVAIMVQYYGMIDGRTESFDPRAWLGIAGVIIFGVSWLWALATSVRIIRQEQQHNRIALDQTPGEEPVRKSDLV